VTWPDRSGPGNERQSARTLLINAFQFTPRFVEPLHAMLAAVPDRGGCVASMAQGTND